MAGGIYERGKIWWCWWRESVKDPKTGKLRQRKRYASSQSERRGDAITLLSTKIHESSTRKPRLDLPDPSYIEVRDAWLKHREAVLARKGLKVDKLQDGTIYFAGRKYLDSFFTGWQAKNIDTPDIERLQQELLAKGLGNGIDRMVAALRAMLRYAVEQKRLNKEQLPQRFPMVRRQRRRPEPIDEKFFDAIRKELPEPYRTAFVLAWHSGMRLSEVGRLRWSHVELAKGRLYFPGAKTGEYRYVALLADTPKLLKALKPGKPNDLVFPGIDDRTESARAWRTAAVAAGCGSWHCRKCGARLDNLTCPEHGKLSERAAKYEGPLFRHTRHTFIRRLTNKGVPLVRVMQMTGHKNIPTHLGYNVAEEADLDLIRKAYK